MSIESTSSSTTLRPRNRRPTQEAEDAASFTASKPRWLNTPALSSSSSRATSSLPSYSHPLTPPRPNIQDHRSSSTSRSLGVTNLWHQKTSSSFASGLWESSWSSIQGIASNLIGSEISRVSTPGHSPTRRRRHLENAHDRNTSAPPAQWGPSGGEGKRSRSDTKEDRKAQVQAKKRETLLTANGHVAPDALGRYKRRDSDERNTGSAPPGENDDREAVVYLHKVKPEDTMAGVLIKYNCQPDVFRKANRFWPNDSIQFRKNVVLPVDACGVRGRKIPEKVDTLSFLGDGNMEETMPTPTAFHAPWGDLHDTPESKQTPFSSIPTSPSISISFSNPEEPLWKHDSWVMIDGFPDAVEIGRLSRKTLGYFPRSRRKSGTFSDVGTPPASLDLPRASYQSTSPRRQDSKANSRSSSGSYFAHQLQGPGGVGTMNSNVRSPGPAQDGLNKLFTAHPPKAAPRTSFESVHSTSSYGNGTGNGIENVGGAIEGWVRKLAIKASSSLQSPTPGGKSGVGDLIELSEDAFDPGEDLQGGEEGKRNTITSADAASGVGAWSAEQERILQDRFPPRGRVFRESSKRGNSDFSRSGKAD